MSAQIHHWDSPRSALKPLRLRAILLSVFAGIAGALLVALAALLAAMWFDLTIPMSVSARRMVVPVALGAATVAMIWILLRSVPLWRETAIAQRVDDVVGTGGQVLTGLDLAERTPSNVTGLGRGLASIAVRRGKELIASADPRTTIPADRTRRWWLMLAGFSGGLAIVALMLPRLAWTQTQRILAPTETQLPYSPSTLTITPGDVEVLYGNDLEVVAEVAGPELLSVDLVMEYEDGQREVLPMLPDGDRKWRVYLTRLIASARYQAVSGGTVSDSHQLSVRMMPQISEARYRITPPSYTRRGVLEGAINAEGIAGLVGSEVEFRVVSNRPLGSGRLTFKYEDDSTQEMEMEVDPARPDSVTGRFTLTVAGQFSISIFDIDGLESTETLRGPIRILADESPMVALVNPKQVSLATPDAVIPVEVLAEDDYGISSLTLFRSLNGSPGMPLQLDIEPGARVMTKTLLPLAQYGLEPGDEIVLFARVEDNDPERPKGIESELVTLQIISQEQLAELELSRQGAEALMSKQRQIQRMLESLAKQLKELAEQAEELAEENAGSDPENAEQQAALAEKQKQLQQAMSDAMRALAQTSQSLQRMSENPLPIDVDESLAERAAEMSDRLLDMAEELAELAERQANGEELSENELEQLNELAKALAGEQQQQESQVMESMERLMKTLPLAAAQKKFEQLVERQRNLAERMSALEQADASDPATVRRSEDLRREQQSLQRMMENVLDEIENGVTQLPADPELDQLRQTASDFSNRLRESLANEKMTSAQEQLLADEPGAATKSATEAAEILESFLDQNEQMGNQACENCKASFNPSKQQPKLGNSIEQLLKRMGLGSGQSPMQGAGMGMGAGGGSSARTTTMDNVGIYGGQPRPEPTPKRGNGQQQSNGGFATSSLGGNASSAKGDGSGGQPAAARGDASNQVPPLYQGRVSDYFRVLSEELGSVNE